MVFLTSVTFRLPVVPAAVRNHLRAGGEDLRIALLEENLAVLTPDRVEPSSG